MTFFEFGQHTLVLGDDGISILTYRGPVSFEEMNAMLATEDLFPIPDVVLLICHIGQVGKIDANARRLGSQKPKLAKRYFTAYIGANFGFRVMVDMWTRATNFLQGHKYVIAFFDNEDAARIWLLGQKADFEKKQ